MKKNLAISLPREMYEQYKECSVAMGKTLSELTRELIEALISGNLRIKRSYKEDEQQVERNKRLYGVD